MMALSLSETCSPSLRQTAWLLLMPSLLKFLLGILFLCWPHLKPQLGAVGMCRGSLCFGFVSGDVIFVDFLLKCDYVSMVLGFFFSKTRWLFHDFYKLKDNCDTSYTQKLNVWSSNHLPYSNKKKTLQPCKHLLLYSSTARLFHQRQAAVSAAGEASDLAFQEVHFRETANTNDATCSICLGDFRDQEMPHGLQRVSVCSLKNG